VPVVPAVVVPVPAVAVAAAAQQAHSVVAQVAG